MHPEILSKEQKELLPFLKKFNKSFYLVGGTAIALHLGHRHPLFLNMTIIINSLGNSSLFIKT
jgi:hypothetical protein